MGLEEGARVPYRNRAARCPPFRAASRSGSSGLTFDELPGAASGFARSLMHRPELHFQIILIASLGFSTLFTVVPTIPFLDGL